MANRFVAGASGSAVRRHARLPRHRPARPHRQHRHRHLPLHRRGAGRSPALRPDVAIIHAQQADRQGNVMLWGILGVQKEAVLSARRSIVTVEEIVDRLQPRPGPIVLPSWVVTAVAEVPHGAHPSYAAGYYDRDNAFYQDWDDISRDRRHFPNGLTSMSGLASTRLPAPVTRLYSRRHDDRRRGPPAGGWDGVLRRHRHPESGRQPGPPLDAPNCVLIYESGCIGAKPTCRPFRSATESWPKPPTPSCRCQRSSTTGCRRAASTWGFWAAAQIDRFGNLNTTVVGPYDDP